MGRGKTMPRINDVAQARPHDDDGRRPCHGLMRWRKHLKTKLTFLSQSSNSILLFLGCPKSIVREFAIYISNVHGHNN